MYNWSRVALITGALALLANPAPLSPGHTNSLPDRLVKPLSSSSSSPNTSINNLGQISLSPKRAPSQKNIYFSQVVFTRTPPSQSAVENGTDEPEAPEEVVMDYTHDAAANDTVRHPSRLLPSESSENVSSSDARTTMAVESTSLPSRRTTPASVPSISASSLSVKTVSPEDEDETLESIGTTTTTNPSTMTFPAANTEASVATESYAGDLRNVQPIHVPMSPTSESSAGVERRNEGKPEAAQVNGELILQEPVEEPRDVIQRIGNDSQMIAADKIDETIEITSPFAAHFASPEQFRVSNPSLVNESPRETKTHDVLSPTEEVNPTQSDVSAAEEIPIVTSQISNGTKDEQVSTEPKATGATVEVVEAQSSLRKEADARQNDKALRGFSDFDEVKVDSDLATVQPTNFEVVLNKAVLPTQDEVEGNATIEPVAHEDIDTAIVDSITTTTPATITATRTETTPAEIHVDHETQMTTEVGSGSLVKEHSATKHSNNIAVTEKSREEPTIGQEAPVIESNSSEPQEHIEVELTPTHQATTIRIPISKITTPIINFYIDVTTESMPTHSRMTNSTTQKSSNQEADKEFSHYNDPKKLVKDTAVPDANQSLTNPPLAIANVTRSPEPNERREQVTLANKTYEKVIDTKKPSSISITTELTLTNRSQNSDKAIVEINENAPSPIKLVSLLNATEKSDSRKVEEMIGATSIETAKKPIMVLPDGSTDINVVSVGVKRRAPHFQASSTVVDGTASMLMLDTTSSPPDQVHRSNTEQNKTELQHTDIVPISRALESHSSREQSQKGAVDLTPHLSGSNPSITTEDIQASEDIGLADLDILGHFGTVDPKMVYGIIRETSSTAGMPTEGQQEAPAPAWRSAQVSENTARRDDLLKWQPQDPNFALGLEGLFELKSDQAKMRVVNSGPPDVKENSSRLAVTDVQDQGAPITDGSSQPPLSIPSFFSDGPPSDMMQFPWAPQHNKFFRNPEAKPVRKVATWPLSATTTSTEITPVSRSAIGGKSRAVESPAIESATKTQPLGRSSSGKINLFFPKKAPVAQPRPSVAVAPKKFNLFSSLTQSQSFGNGGDSKPGNRRPILPFKRTPSTRWEPSIEPPSDEDDDSDRNKDLRSVPGKEPFFGNYERRLVIDTLPTSTTLRPRPTPEQRLHDFHRNDHQHRAQEPQVAAAGGFQWDWPRRRSQENPYDLSQDEDPYDLLLRGTPPAPRAGYHPISERARATLLMCAGIVVGAAVFFASMLLVCRRRSQNARLLRRRAVDKFIAEQHDGASEAASSYGGSHSSYGRKNLLSPR